LDPDDAAQLHVFIERVGSWLLKAIREAKQNTDWGIGNEAYESATLGFLRAILEPGRTAPFIREVAAFARHLEAPGMAKGLTQLALKCLATAVPDFYQGTEWWDFSLVDPDNRGPVDFTARRLAQERDAPLTNADWRRGTAKHWLMRRLLDLRRTNPGLFAGGRYQVLNVTGEMADDWFTALVSGNGMAVLLLAPRLVSRLIQHDQPMFRCDLPLDTTHILLPKALHGAISRNVLGPGVLRLRRRMPIRSFLPTRWPLIVHVVDPLSSGYAMIRRASSASLRLDSKAPPPKIGRGSAANNAGCGGRI